MELYGKSKLGVFLTFPALPAARTATSYASAAATYIVGFGRIVISEIEAPNMLVNLV